MNHPAMENKMLTAPPETKVVPFARVPTGQVDAELRVRMLRDGAVPRLDIRTFKRSPADVSADAFLPTAAGVTIEAQFLPVLLEAIAKASA